jgi:hypothetical protein
MHRRESFQAAQDHVKAARLAVRVSAIIQFVRQLQLDMQHAPSYMTHPPFSD